MGLEDSQETQGPQRKEWPGHTPSFRHGHSLEARRHTGLGALYSLLLTQPAGAPGLG